jgi:diaminopimelate decarboxylase
LSFYYLGRKVKARGRTVAFQFKNGEWKVSGPGEDLSLSELTQGRGRPFYFYDLDDAVMRAGAFAKSGFGCHFAVKSNTNHRLLKAFAKAGIGADVTSLGELQKALQSFAPAKVVFSGVGKDSEDLECAVAHKILQINAESFPELKEIAATAAKMNRDVSIALRVNIHLTAPTHEYVQTANRNSKFGLELRQIPEALDFIKKNPHLKLNSLTVHIGSQIEDVSVFTEMGRQIGALYRDVKAKGFPLERLDLGGGLGLDYETNGEKDMSLLAEYFTAIKSSHGTDAKIILEPGRFLVARMGVLLAKVVYVKPTEDQTFLILNAGMNHLMRPALYGSYHRIHRLKPDPSAEKAVYTVVGPVCESTDEFAAGRLMDKSERGDWVGIFDAGAYGAVMASRFNENAWPEEWTRLEGRMEVT